MDCTGCGKPLGVIEALRWDVCLDCTKARARTASNHGRCSCGRKARAGKMAKTFSRKWTPCLRCLGTIKQIS